VSTCFNDTLVDFEKYAVFLNAVQYGMTVVYRLWDDPKTKVLLDECRAESKQRFGLSDMLKVPFQRILKYPLLLTELWKKTPEAHFDKTGLQGSLEGIKRVSE
jgi:guanine nucleotide exchange factor VAV